MAGHIRHCLGQDTESPTASLHILTHRKPDLTIHAGYVWGYLQNFRVGDGGEEPYFLEYTKELHNLPAPSDMSVECEWEFESVLLSKLLATESEVRKFTALVK